METKTKLRTGFTTGSCATASSKACVLSIINQKKIEQTDIILPKRSKLDIQINSCEFTENSATCSVIKDGGDDPDVTHGAEIFVYVELTNNIGKIEIDGGEGVGRVTKPGLGLEIGSAAINPTPKKMILENVTEISKEILEKNGIMIKVSVPNGKELGPKTDNPRIGIMGGISILGTSGIVIPYSTASFAAAIRQQIAVVSSMNDDNVVLTTGGRSEDFARAIIELPDHSFIQMGDFSGYTIKQCAKQGLKKAYVAGFIGKLAKMAAGVKQTHVKGGKVDMKFLSELAKRCDAKSYTISKILGANTARNVQEIIIEDKVDGFFDEVTKEACNQMRQHSEEKIPVEVILFDFDGKVLSRDKKE
ncbi:MAG: cobalt-precorrin-5B (C(1))-methyltransferase [Candidatus Nitrosopelagicus sp.]|nr:cobalt-precorrin-5B (C(1))-methyltransferase [Candidatus Nitrosopelagicus sp.]MBT5171062.1 cobalt-precorrin-5B (C(1))-methyltransferase [Candidatus Nitrosopelagicus sp.]